ncbi:MAG: hypothetical protein ACLUW6_08685 [Coriobacteriaceae bacterium]
MNVFPSDVEFVVRGEGLTGDTSSAYDENFHPLRGVGHAPRAPTAPSMP